MLKLSMIVAGFLLFCSCRAGAQEAVFPQVPGWTMSMESRVYDANDLWDIIDGAADLYLEYAFIDLHIARYKTDSTREVKAELYRHRDAENAFGIYSAERNPEYHFIAIGTQGYQQTSVLNFVEGEYYVRLSSYQSDSASGIELRAIADAVEKKLHRSPAFPTTLSLFPASGKQLNGEQFVALNFLGYGFFRSVYTAAYGGSSPFKAFIMEKQSAADAGKTMNEYFSKVPAANIHRLGEDRFDIEDPNNGGIAIARQGKYLYGVVNCTSTAAQNEVMGGLKTTLSRP